MPWTTLSPSAKITVEPSDDPVPWPIADDGVAYLLNLYEEGLRTLEELARELEYKDLNNQFCFLTDRAISLLHRVK